MNARLSAHIALGLLLLLPAGVLLGQQGTEGQDDQRQGEAAFVEGLRAFENESYQEAIDLLQQAHSALPGSAGVNHALADAYLHTGNLSDAAAYGRQAVKLDSTNKWYRLKLVEIYREAGRNEATITQLREALEYHPGDTDVLYQLADALASRGERAESNRYFNRLMEIRGPSVEIELRKLRNFNEMAMQDSSIATLNRIRRLDPDNLANLQLLSSYYRKVGRRAEAKEVLREALRQNSRDPKTRIMFSELLAEESKWDSVSVMLGEVVSDSLVSREGKMSVSEFMLSRFRDDTSNAALREATGRLLEQFRTAEPGYGPAHALAADFFSFTGQNGRALEALESTTELMPSNSQAWTQRLQLLLAEGRTSEVVEIAPEAEEHVPQDPFVLFFTGSAYLQEGRHRTAAEKLREAARLPARRDLKSAIYVTLGDAWAGLDEWDESNAAYEEALRLDPGNPTLLNNYAYALARQGERLEEAEGMILKALEAQPGNAAFLDTAGWVYFQMEAYEKAREYIRKSIESGDASAEVLEHMGDVLNELGQTEQARSWWRKALEMAPGRTHLKEKIDQ